MDRDELLRVVRNELHDPMNGRVGARIFDLHRNEEVLSHEANNKFLLASLTKIFTIGTALEHLGGEKRFTTCIAASTPLTAGGTISGDLYVIGGGDPTLTARKATKSYLRHLSHLVEAIAAAGVRRVTGDLVGDTSLFSNDNPHTNWVPALGLHHQLEKPPAQSATRAIKAAIEDAGIVIQGEVMERQAPADAEKLTSIESPTVRALTEATGHHSDNYIAEALTKQISTATSRDGVGQTRRGCAVIEKHAASRGADIQLKNGSGLKVMRGKRLTGNLGTPAGVVDYLRAMWKREDRHMLLNTLPRAASEGTLEGRMRNTAAVGVVRAKTGTLTLNGKPAQDSIAGYCMGSAGALGFAFIYQDAVSRFVARSSLDRVADAMAKHCGTPADDLTVTP